MLFFIVVVVVGIIIIVNIDDRIDYLLNKAHRDIRIKRKSYTKMYVIQNEIKIEKKI